MKRRAHNDQVASDLWRHVSLSRAHVGAFVWHCLRNNGSRSSVTTDEHKKVLLPHLVDDSESSDRMTLLELVRQAHLVVCCDHGLHLTLRRTQSTNFYKGDGGSRFSTVTNGGGVNNLSPIVSISVSNSFASAMAPSITSVRLPLLSCLRHQRTSKYTRCHCPRL